MAHSNSVRLALCAAFAAAAFVACGGGSGTRFPVPTANPTATPLGTPTPPVVPTAAPFSATTAAPLPAVTAAPAGQTPQPVPVVVPTSSAASVALSLPIASSSSIAANTSAIVTLTNQAPANVPVLAFAQPGRDTRAAARPFAGSSIVPIVFLNLAFSGGVTLSNLPSLTFSVEQAQIVPGATYWIALYDFTRPSVGWQLGFEGPGTVSGSSIAFTGSGAFSFVPFSPYVFALYAQSATASTPTPAPTPTPTPVPTPTPTPGATPTPIPPPAFGISPSSISLYAVGATQTITATGTAPYFAFTSNASVVTISPPNGNSPFTATAAGAGTAQITIVDSTGKQAIIPVTVTTTTIPVQ